ncbi:Cytochrome P450 [Melia azedarach]|uniref:Cytochrome P450 n=2 Tax=Melia azedarach TaxID=155640 RepID=A0ACC1YQ06_MELAZ|nr:Cytochrome P450 [Melia azedarach]
MELGFSSFSSIFLAFLLFLFIFLKLWRFKTSDTNSNPPPGPWKLPVIGNIHQLVCSLPHHRLRDLAKKYGPLMHLQLGEVYTIVVSSPEFAKEVMKTHDAIFASRPHDLATKIMTYDCTDIAFSPYGGYWRQLRKICISEVLSLKRVQSFRSIREEEVSDLINSISSKAGSVINLTDQVFSLMYGITSRSAFGSKREDQQVFILAIKEGIKVVASLNIANLFPSVELLQSITGIKHRAERFHHEADRVIENIISEHKQRREALKLNEISEDVEDLVDVLLKIQEQGDLEFSFTNDNIKAVIHDIFSAGSETSATTVDWAMCEMTKNHRVMKKAQAEVREVFNRLGKVDETGIDELKYLKVVIKETLRLHPPAFLIPRECGQQCEINGFNVPVKTRVIVNVWAMGRDPRYWNEPESFIPERFLDSSIDYKGNNFEYIPFGAGRRICPGMSFGLASMELPVAMLLYHFNWKLPGGMKLEDLDMTETFGLTIRRKNDLQLIPIPLLIT